MDLTHCADEKEDGLFEANIYITSDSLCIHCFVLVIQGYHKWGSLLVTILIGFNKIFQSHGSF